MTPLRFVFNWIAILTLPVWIVPAIIFTSECLCGQCVYCEAEEARAKTWITSRWTGIAVLTGRKWIGEL